MDLTSGIAAAAAVDEPCGHCRGERRTAGERRRAPRGWLEMLARRDGIEVDRRRDRRDGWWRRVYWSFVRRSGKA